MKEKIIERLVLLSILALIVVGIRQGQQKQENAEDEATITIIRLYEALGGGWLNRKE